MVTSFTGTIRASSNRGNAGGWDTLFVFVLFVHYSRYAFFIATEVFDLEIMTDSTLAESRLIPKNVF